jgi:hypothetical protein
VALRGIRRDPDNGAAAALLVDLIEALHRASSDAAAQCFPLMARRLDECGFEFAKELAHDRPDERELVDRARACLEMWNALREW